MRQVYIMLGVSACAHHVTSQSRIFREEQDKKLKRMHEEHLRFKERMKESDRLHREAMHRLSETEPKCSGIFDSVFSIFRLSSPTPDKNKLDDNIHEFTISKNEKRF